MSLKLQKPEDLSAFQKQGDGIFKGLSKLVTVGNIYEHQAEAVQAIKKDLLHNQIVTQPGNYSNVSLVVLPTGTGKTGVGVLAAYACRAKKVLVVTPSEAISKQQYTQFMPVYNETVNPLKNKPFLCQRGIFQLDGPADYDYWVPRSKCVLKTKELKTVREERHELVVANAHKFGDGSGKGVDIKMFPIKYFSLVIVDEAHHFPARTWKNIVDHFKGGELILFLTATPFNRGEYILPSKGPCYKFSHEDAVKQGIIRETSFFEVNENPIDDEHVILHVLKAVKDTLDNHDSLDKRHSHKAMLLARDKDHAKQINKIWNDSYGSDEDTCCTFIQNDRIDNVNKFMTEREQRCLVVIYRLTEGFDCKEVSVVAILRNVNKKSRVYFSQFVGRAVRKLEKDDPVEAKVISHKMFNQRQNYEAFKNCKIAEDTIEDPGLKDAEDIEQEQDCD